MSETRMTFTATDVACKLESLLLAEDLLLKVWKATPRPDGSLPDWPHPPIVPTGRFLQDLSAELHRAEAVRDTLLTVYSSTGSYCLPTGMPCTKENELLWSKVQDYFGFDDSE